MRGGDGACACCMAAIPARSHIRQCFALLMGSEAAILLQRGKAIGVALPPPFLGVSSLDLGCSGNVSGPFLFYNPLNCLRFFAWQAKGRPMPRDELGAGADVRAATADGPGQPIWVLPGSGATKARFSTFARKLTQKSFVSFV
jgi:hypothetical protein